MIRNVALATVFFSVAGWPLLAQLPQVRIGILLDGPSDFNRQSLLNTWIADLELQNAPQELRRILTYLLDGEVAKTALRLLEE